MKIKRFKSVEAWQARASELFGDDFLGWRFVCPVCGNVASVKDFSSLGAPANSATINCLGRYLPEGKVRNAFGLGSGRPCNYAGLGLIRLSPVRVSAQGSDHHVFAFDGDADAERGSDALL